MHGVSSSVKCNNNSMNKAAEDCFVFRELYEEPKIFRQGPWPSDFIVSAMLCCCPFEPLPRVVAFPTFRSLKRHLGPSATTASTVTSRASRSVTQHNLHLNGRCMTQTPVDAPPSSREVIQHGRLPQLFEPLPPKGTRGPGTRAREQRSPYTRKRCAAAAHRCADAEAGWRGQERWQGREACEGAVAATEQSGGQCDASWRPSAPCTRGRGARPWI